MKKDTFEQQMDEARERLETLFQRAGALPGQPSLLQEALEELSITLEELQVAGEQLRQQNEELLAARQSIEAERQRYQELFDFAPDGYLVTDAAGIIQEANRAAAASLSVSQEFLVGKPLVIFVAEEDRKPFHLQLSRLVVQPLLKRLEDWEVNLQPREGKSFPAFVTVTVMRNPADKLVGLRWLIRDITERKRQEKLAQLASFPELNPNPVVEVDLTGDVYYINPAAKQLFPDLHHKGLTHPWLMDLEKMDETLKSEYKRVHVRELRTGDNWYQQTIHSVMEGRRLRIYGLDITERKQAEEAIKASEKRAHDQAARLQAVLDTTPAIIWIAQDKECREIIGNRAAYVFLRVPEGTDMSKSGRAPERLVHYRVFKDGVELTAREMPIQRVAASGQGISDYAMELVFNDGTVRSVLGNISPVFDTEGQSNGAIAAFIDITERKRMAGELRKSRDELELRVQERTAELVKVNQELRAEITERKRTEETLQKRTYDLNERVKEINCLYSISYYVDKQYLLLEEKLKNIVNLIPSGWQYPEITCARISLEDNEYKTDNFKKTAWKQSCDILASNEKIGTIEIYYLEKKPEAYDGPFLKEERGLINTIAIELGEMIAHMRAEKALVEQSRILEGFFTSTMTPFVFLDRNFNFIRVNEAYAKACQRQISDFPGHNHFEFYPSDAKEIFERVVETKIPYQAFAKPFSFPDHPEWGVTYWNWSLTPLLDDKGEVEFLVFALQDVSERKRAEKELRAASLYARSLIEASLDPLVTISADGKVMDVNKATELTTGVSRDQVIGSDFSDYFIEPEKAREGYQRVFETGSVKNYPLAIRHTSGHVTEVLYNAAVYKNEAGEVQGIFAAARDITEQKEAEKRTNATNALLGLFSEKTARKEYLDAVVELIQEWSACRCVGIRVLDDRGYIPYESYVGFSQEFWERENWISVHKDSCACIRVVTGNPDPQDLSYMTPRGSFCCGNTSKLLVHLSEEEKERFRGVCIQNGFLSVYVIPICYHEKAFGAIHLADEREVRLTRKRLEFVESMAPLIGEAVNRFNLEEKLRQSENRLRALSSQLLLVQENERKRIAVELHDSIGQMLTAIKFKIESILQQKNKKKSLETLISLVRESIEEVRRIQMDLRPSTLDDLGVLATLEWFCREYQKIYSHIRIEKEIGLRESEVSAPLKTVIYRLTQEALNNIAKHSKADLIHLSLQMMEDKIELVIKDNGIGFGLEEILSSERPKKGLGLNSMRERTELSGGTFAIETTPGTGTMIRVNWPTF